MTGTAEADRQVMLGLVDETVKRRAEVAELRAHIAIALALHIPKFTTDPPFEICAECGRDYPCHTISALTAGAA